MVISAFTILEAQADQSIDALYGEQLVVTPYTKDQYKTPVVDTSRPVQNMVGYVIGANQMGKPSTPGSLKSRLESGQNVNVQNKYIKFPVEKGDRILFVARNETWEVASVDDSPHNRTSFNLIQVVA